jgi:WhiB family redox-sensing transcriptional regulator
VLTTDTGGFWAYSGDMRISLNPLKAPSWMLEGMCVGATGINFFPGKGEDKTPARKICASCPVLTQCLDYAIIFNESGIWGGLTKSEREHKYSPEVREFVRDDYFGG